MTGDGELAEGVTGPPDDPQGPRTLVVVVGMLVAAAVVVGGVAGWTAWKDRASGDDDAAADAAAAPTTGPAGDAAAAEGEWLFRRTTDAGIDIRAESMTANGVDVEMFGMPVGDDAPDHCRQIDQVNAAALDGNAVVATALPVTAGLDGEVSPMSMYGSVGRGIVGLAIQVDRAVARVTLVGPDGVVDEMEPVDGIAVVAVPGASDPQQAMFGGGLPDGFVVTARTADGRSTRVDNDVLAQGPRLWNDQQCFDDGFIEVGEVEAPAVTVDGSEVDEFAVDLPPPGAVQPADVTAARAAVAAALDAFYGTNRDDVMALVDDPFAMREMIDELGEGVQRRRFDDVSVDIEDLVFLSDVEAAIDYSLDTRPASQDELFGRARVVGGRWVLTRGTACQGLEFFEVICPS